MNNYQKADMIYIKSLERKLKYLTGLKEDLLSNKPLIFKKKWNEEIEKIENEEEELIVKINDAVEELYNDYK